MKSVVTSLIVGSLGVAGTYLIVSYTKDSQFQKDRSVLEAQWQTERTQLEADLRSTRKTAAPVQGTQAVAAPRPTGPAISPDTVLDTLSHLRIPSGKDRNKAMRQVVYYLESLSAAGNNALPAIRTFMARLEDVDYLPAVPLALEEAEESSDAEPKASASRTEPRLESALPATLRMGLIDVLREIGGSQAESVLAEVLINSGRGAEVAHVARVLQEMAPNKYREAAIAAAHELLANPPKIDNPNRLDQKSKDYLYSVLAMYGDTSFANSAHRQLINAEGGIDRDALGYLTSTLKEQAVPYLYEAYKDNRLTNIWEKNAVINQMIEFTGSNPQANQVFNEVIQNESLPAWMRAITIRNMAGSGFFGGSMPTSPAEVQARINLLSQMPEPSDEQMAAARKDAIERLSSSLAVGGASDTERKQGALFGPKSAPLPPGGDTIPQTVQ